MAEAYASHLGQFIHKGGQLSQLRKNLTNLPAIEWMNVRDGEKTPVKIQKHHTAQELLAVHEQIANVHRVHEQRVNYYKAKVKNLVSDENARIQKESADKAEAHRQYEQRISEEFSASMNAFRSQLMAEKSTFNAAREQELKDAAALRISVDPRFQDVIDMFITPEN
jgi:DNA gyrase/topoisomerase IV subunit A